VSLGMQCCLATFIVYLYLMICGACCHCTHACIQTYVCLRACITFDHTFSSVTYIYMYACMYVCIYTHTHTHVYEYVCMCTYTHTHTRISVYTHTRIKTYLKIYVRTYMYIVGVLFSQIEASSTGLLLGCTISKQYAPEAALIRFLKSKTYSNCFLSLLACSIRNTSLFNGIFPDWYVTVYFVLCTRL
jgi:hypothetical protein